MESNRCALSPKCCQMLRITRLAALSLQIASIFFDRVPGALEAFLLRPRLLYLTRLQRLPHGQGQRPCWLADCIQYMAKGERR